MIKKITFILALVVVAGTANCGTFINRLSATKGLHGFDQEGWVFANTTRSETMSDSIGSKRGQACQMAILGPLVALGDASLPEARRAGGITKVNHVTYEKMRVLGVLFMKDCMTVYGE